MPAAWGRGVATSAASGAVLDTWYRHLGLGPAPDPGIVDDLAPLAGHDAIRDVTIDVVAVEIDTDVAPATAVNTPPHVVDAAGDAATA